MDLAKHNQRLALKTKRCHQISSGNLKNVRRSSILTYLILQQKKSGYIRIFFMLKIS